MFMCSLLGSCSTPCKDGQQRVNDVCLPDEVIAFKACTENQGIDKRLTESGVLELVQSTNANKKNKESVAFVAEYLSERIEIGNARQCSIIAGCAALVGVTNVPCAQQESRRAGGSSEGLGTTGGPVDEVKTTRGTPFGEGKATATTSTGTPLDEEKTTTSAPIDETKSVLPHGKDRPGLKTTCKGRYPMKCRVSASETLGNHGRFRSDAYEFKKGEIYDIKAAGCFRSEDKTKLTFRLVLCNPDDEGCEDKDFREDGPIAVEKREARSVALENTRKFESTTKQKVVLEVTGGTIHLLKGFTICVGKDQTCGENNAECAPDPPKP